MLPNFPGISSATIGLGSPIAEAIYWTLADFSIKIESIVASEYFPRRSPDPSGDPATRVAALQSGLVDATGLSPPFTLTAKRTGFNVFDSIPALASLEYPSASLIVRQESIREDPIVLDRVTRSLIEAVHFFKTRKTASKRILQKYLRLQNQEELEEAYTVLSARFNDKPYPTIQSIKTILDWSKHPKQRSPIPPSS